MFLDTCTSVKAALMGTVAQVDPFVGGYSAIDESGISLPRDAENEECRVVWAEGDPRAHTPTDIELTTTHISIGLVSDTPNPQLMRFPEKIFSAMVSNGIRIHRRNPHPEARSLSFMITVRGEGALALPNIVAASSAVRRRLKHRSHLKVATDLYRDTRSYSIPSLVVLKSTHANRPQGSTRRTFSYDMTYSVDSWILYPGEREDITSVQSINLSMVDDTSGAQLQEHSITIS